MRPPTKVNALYSPEDDVEDEVKVGGRTESGDEEMERPEKAIQSSVSTGVGRGSEDMMKVEQEEMTNPSTLKKRKVSQRRRGLGPSAGAEVDQRRLRSTAARVPHSGCCPGKVSTWFQLQGALPSQENRPAGRDYWQSCPPLALAGTERGRRPL